MNSHLPYHRKPAGFVQSGIIELLLLACVVAAVLNLALGHWKVGMAILVPLSVIFIGVQCLAKQDRWSTGDRVQISMGLHAGKEGVVIRINEPGTLITVQLSSEKHPDPVDFSAYQIVKMKPTAADETTS